MPRRMFLDRFRSRTRKNYRRREETFHSTDETVEREDLDQYIQVEVGKESLSNRRTVIDVSGLVSQDECIPKHHSKILNAWTRIAVGK